MLQPKTDQIKDPKKRDRPKLAVSLAMERRWDEAVLVNKEILEETPNNLEALNRLGKAQSEIGLYAAARMAFRRVLELSPANGIAKKNLERVALLRDDQTPKPSRQAVPPNFLTGETGKTGVTALIDVAPPRAKAKLTVGDTVVLEPQEHKLLVRNVQGEYIGTMEPRLGLRLLRLIRGGNRYAAAVAAVHDQELRVIIKETYQHPSQQGRLPFPPKDQGTSRSYVRERAGQLVAEDEDEDAAEDPGDDEGAKLEDVSSYKRQSHSRRTIDLEGEEEES